MLNVDSAFNIQHSAFISVAFQVLARKWRPQRFDDVIGQRGVTQTLRNAIGARRIAQSFVFSGPRGVAKTPPPRPLPPPLTSHHDPPPPPPPSLHPHSHTT